MTKPESWLRKINNSFFHEKLVLLSVTFVVAILSFDFWFENLPLSGYGLIFITLILICVTIWATCHGIKWLLLQNKPLQTLTKEKESDAFSKLLRIVKTKEDVILQTIFQSSSDNFAPLKYPTSLNEQARLLLKDIEREYIKSWYSEISQNPAFLFDTHLLLEEVLLKVVERLKSVNRKALFLNILNIYLNHLQEYKKAVKKLQKLKHNDCKQKECDLKETVSINESKVKNIEDVYKFTHPASQNDDVLNYYLNKLCKSILHEYCPHEFVSSTQCKVIAGILTRKLFRNLLNTVEDPVWIHLKLLYILNIDKHEELLKDHVYVVEEKLVEQNNEYSGCNLRSKPLLLSRRHLSSNLFEDTERICNKKESTQISDILQNGGSKKEVIDKIKLSLPLCNNNVVTSERPANISTVLGGLISSTAGPLLPDNFSFNYQPLNKMWQSPMVETKNDSIANPFRKGVVEGLKLDDVVEPNTKQRFTANRNKGMLRSRSTDAMSPTGGEERALKTDISIGEELHESVSFAPCSRENLATEDVKENRKTGLKKLVKTRSFDSGSIAIENATDYVLDGGAESPSDKGDVSPVYEEPEDFATTIAKLRTLIQQRESTSTLSDQSSRSIDSQDGGLTKSLDRTESSTKQASGEGEVGLFEPQASCDVPNDGRLFINISIPREELQTDGPGSPYFVYSIQYDGIYLMKETDDGPEDLALQTTVVRRKFQEFLNLQTKLEANTSLKTVMKGIKGPSKWFNPLVSGKQDETTEPSRKVLLEQFIRQLCSKADVSTAAELHDFLGYGSGPDSGTGLVKKEAANSIHRIDRFLASKVTGVFNTIKTALPFDFDPGNSAPDTAKTFQEQKILQGFLSFGNKPEVVEVSLDYRDKEPTGDSLTDNIRHYLSEKSDCIEDALDVLSLTDWMSQQGECHPVTPLGRCVWAEHNHAQLEDELGQLDTWAPIYCLVLDILCELLEDSESWALKEPVVRLIKVFSGHWELRLQEELRQLDWDRIWANVIRLLRLTIFQNSPGPSAELELETTKHVLKEVLLSSIPDVALEFVKKTALSRGIQLLLDSIQQFKLNRDVLLRVLDLFLTCLLSCNHLVE